MKFLDISFDACMVCEADRLSIAERCLPMIKRVTEALGRSYESPYASAYLPFDEQLRRDLLELVHQLRACNPAMLIVIGIGGSNLGTKAVHEALFGANKSTTGMCVYYADTVDPDMISGIIEHARQLLKEGRQILVNIVTKSGTTTETIANGAIFIELLKQYRPDSYRDFIVVTTDTDSKLYDVSREQGWHVLNAYAMVGGRYSAFSAVGLFPLALMGVDIQALQEGAAHMVKRCARAICVPILLFKVQLHCIAVYQRGFVISNFSAFSDEPILCPWFIRTTNLLAESLGKESPMKDEPVNVGITQAASR